MLQTKVVEKIKTHNFVL